MPLRMIDEAGLTAGSLVRSAEASRLCCCGRPSHAFFGSHAEAFPSAGAHLDASSFSALSMAAMNPPLRFYLVPYQTPEGRGGAGLCAGPSYSQQLSLSFRLISTFGSKVTTDDGMRKWIDEMLMLGRIKPT